jgi:hypothetical protein
VAANEVVRKCGSLKYTDKSFGSFHRENYEDILEWEDFPTKVLGPKIWRHA